MKRVTWAVTAIASAAVLSVTGLAISASAGAPYSCTTADLANGACGPYASEQSVLINGAVPPGVNYSAPTITHDDWAKNPAYTATLSANGPSDWQVTASVNTPGDGSIKAFPDLGWGMLWPEVKVDSYPVTTSSWNVTVPTDNTQVDGWAGYDLWFNNWANEVMIQPDVVDSSAYNCSGPNATFSGSTWHLCGPYGSEWVWRPGASEPANGLQGANSPQNLPSGTIDVHAVLDWMMANGQLPANSTWTAGSFGFEVAQTGAQPATWTVNDFSFNADSGTSPTPTPTPTSTTPPTTTPPGTQPPTPTPTPTPTSTTPAPLPAPTGLSQTSHEYVNFGNSAVAGASGYEYQLETAAGVLVTDTHISSIAVTPDTAYQWRVRANGGTWSAWKAFTSP